MQTEMSIEDEIQIVKQRFLKKLSNWIPVCEAFSVSVKNTKVDETDLKNIRLQIHNLAGSARTFGFPKLNDLAAQIEKRLDLLTLGVSIEEVGAELLNALDAFLIEARIDVFTDYDPERPNRLSKSSLEPDHGEYRYNILLADDDALMRDLLKHSLRDEKCRVLHASDGRAILRMLNLTEKYSIVAKPDLIVLDVNMPEMNGFEVLKVIKASPNTQAIPVIMLTRTDQDISVTKGISSGAIDYVTKPFQVPELKSRIMGTLTRRRTKVLIADDDEMIRDLLSTRFHRMGYTVLTARQGNEALARMHSEHPDITLLDIMMPGMDGISVLKQIKSNQTTADLPVVLLTANSKKESKLHGLESGAHDYVTKPFDLDEVAARVTGIMRRHQGLVAA